jgi:hypothetical protein
MKFPEMIDHNIICKPSITLNSLIIQYRNKKEININSENINLLLDGLNVYKTSKSEYISCQPEYRRKLIKTKIEESECSICLEKPKNMSITHCCSNIFCSCCILNTMVVNNNCPICREKLLPSSITTIIDESHNEELHKEYKTKIETLKEYILQNKEEKIIVYSSFNNVFNNISKSLEGESCRINKYNNKYNNIYKFNNATNNTDNILFIDTCDDMKGIKFKEVDHFIFFHEPPSYEAKKLLINSVQHFDQTSSVNIVCLNSCLTL